MRLLLDTTVLIDVLRCRRQRRELLSDLIRAGHALTTSSLNVAEVYAGMRSGEAVATETFLRSLECYELDWETARLAGSVKRDWAVKGKMLGLADTIVAATALQHDCVLMTDNGKHFPMPELSQYPLPQLE
jgi:tRNA(fMet)-specific endonuclease VapC